MRFAIALVVLAACASAPRPRERKLVYSDVVGHMVPELRCDGGTQGFNKDGAIVLCLGPGLR